MPANQVCCWHSLHYGNLALALFQATCYASSIVWLVLVHDKIIEVNLDTSRYLVIFFIGLLSLLVFNCLLLMYGVVLKFSCLLLPWLIGQPVIIVGSIIIPTVLMIMDKITNTGVTITLMVVLNIYQLYHFFCALGIYLRIKDRD